MRHASRPSLAGISLLAFLVPRPAAAQREGTRPAATAAEGTSHVLSDVSSSYDRMEQSIESEYAKLKKQAKDDLDTLEGKVKEVDRQIAALKDQANRIAQVAQKLEEVLPTLMAAVGGDSGGMRRTPSSKADGLAALLASERAKAGLPSTPGFPSLTPADFSTAASHKAASGATFLSSRISQQASRKTAEIGNAIEAKKKELASLKGQIVELDKQLAKLDADKQKAVADLRQQKEKAIAEATKAQDSRIVRIPAPTPK